MVFRERELFEVAVYRLSPEAWSKDVEQRVNRRVEAWLRPQREKGMTIDDAEQSRAETISRQAEKIYGWDYNEVVAWIRVIWDGPGPVIKGYMWEVANPSPDGYGWERRHFRRGFTPFPFFGGIPIHKVLEVPLLGTESDAQIFDDLRSALGSVVGDDRGLAKRYIDLRIFDNVGPHMPWRRLLGLPAS